MGFFFHNIFTLLLQPSPFTPAAVELLAGLDAYNVGCDRNRLDIVLTQEG